MKIHGLAESRNLYPSIYEPEDRTRRGQLARQDAAIDIQEPLRIERRQTLEVMFRYKTGNPPATAFGITWHASEDEADNLVHPLANLTQVYSDRC